MIQKVLELELEHGINLKMKNVPGDLSGAYLHLLMNQPEQARLILSQFKKNLPTNPGDQTLYEYLMAYLLEEESKIHESINAFTRVYEKYKSSEDRDIKVIALKALYYKGRLSKKIDFNQAAFDSLRECRELTKSSKDPAFQVVYAQCGSYLANNHVDENEPAPCIELQNESIHVMERIGEVKNDVYAEMINDKSLCLMSLMTAPSEFENPQTIQDYKDITELLEKALEIRKDVFGPYHSMVAETLQNYAIVLEWQDLYSKAEEKYRQSLDIVRKHLGPNHLESLLCQSNFANFLLSTNHFERARELLLNLVTRIKEAVGLNNRHFLVTLRRLIQACLKLNKIDEAENYYELGIKIERVVAKDGVNETLPMHNSYLTHLYKLRKFDQAEEVFLLAIETRKKILGEKHLDVGRSYDSLAAKFLQLQNLEKALKYNSLALEIYDSQEKRPGLLYIQALFAQSEILLRLKEYERAIKILTRYKKTLAGNIRAVILQLKIDEVLLAAYKGAKQWEKALEVLTGMESIMDSSGAYNEEMKAIFKLTRGDIHSRLGEFAQADLAFEELIAKYSQGIFSDSDSLSTLLSHELRKKDSAKALEYAEVLLKLLEDHNRNFNPEYALTLLMKSKAYGIGKKCDRAKQTLEQAKELMLLNEMQDEELIAEIEELCE